MKASRGKRGILALRYGLEVILHKFSPETYGMQMKDWKKDGEPVRDTSITSTGSQIIKDVECSAYIEDEISIGYPLAGQ